MTEPEISPQDEAARAGWLYYVGGLTQDQVAAELGVSRQRAQRLVAKAMADGLVHVRLEHKISACLDLEVALSRRFALKLARVVPALPAGVDTARGTAPAAAQLLERYLAQPEPLIIAFGTGRSLSAMAAEVIRTPLAAHRIVSLISNIAPDGSASFYDVILRMADKLQLPHYPMLVPVITDTIAERALFNALRPVQAVMELAARADVTFVGIGQLNDEAPLFKDGFITRAQHAELQAAGAVGEIVGGIFDAEGRYIDTETTRLIGSFRIPAEREQPVIGIAAGLSKQAAIRAALRGRLINGLVTDESTARALLA
ncbi:sugar-binding transcriptional regulator [Rhodobacter capsulatus]|uniref:Transcriptional regulator, DeoR family n=2 Tax=Rhodobacter capsulatus TaxID=1061 RepID=D5AUX6_RHOCB|nr:sugar-binding domain-containing protein [Rhodobacter capsulatus]AAC16207.1 potential transcriptional regulator [Rhodobacter capsulatus SB 1003]ADE85765.1 transcriptional regulator, DeoR family [Rhodobacter capsulatus SB 1003]ETD01765.1 DeoR family transcriptional regulator [Rhodobacter capsulatus DE442]ETD76833.1 DeoR family transcriptional regulator [Rhodobacter capsulatus R121]ETD81960.1 DeoR family transcriptional regulator [Rhodobacter capsulatus YW1]